MIKSAILSVFSVFLVGVFSFDDGVFVTHNTPDFMQSGATETVTVLINKAELQGFGKLLLDIPIGFTAEPGDLLGASFTFSDQKAKFIWMTMPTEQEFTISYKLKAPTSFKGIVSIEGVFSYIKNNQRIDYQLADKKITAGQGDLVEKSEEVIPETEEIVEAIVDQGTEEVTTNEIISEEITTEENLINVDNLTCKREFERVADDKVLITVTIYESELRGFGKVQDSFDAKYEVSEADSDGAITTFEDGSVKYVWFEVPGKNQFAVSYYLEHESLKYEEPEVNGSFTYVYDDKPVELKIQKTNSLEPVEVMDVASNEAIKEEEPVIEEEEDFNINTTLISETTTSNTNTNDNQYESVTEKVSVVTDPETGIVYKVQIVAGPNTVGKSYMRKRHSFYDNFNIENHDGWVKYTTGSFDMYKGARDHREKVNKGYNFNGPFVTAYNDGTRITVQEALMITNQQWYQ